MQLRNINPKDIGADPSIDLSVHSIYVPHDAFDVIVGFAIAKGFVDADLRNPGKQEDDEHWRQGSLRVFVNPFYEEGRNEVHLEFYGDGPVVFDFSVNVIDEEEWGNSVF